MNEHTRPVVILHIPKTAGTSLRRMIQEHYQPEDIFYIYGEDSKYTTFEDFRKLTPEEKATYRIFMGHIPFNQKLFAGLDPLYVTMLRDPVERILSYYHHVMQREEWKGRELSLLKYIETSDDKQLSDHQVRMLTGYPGKPVDGNQLATAINNLQKHFLLVGTTEYFKETAESLCNCLGIEQTTIFRENISAGRKPQDYYSKYEIGKIRELNQFDLKLYDHVLNISQNTAATSPLKRSSSATCPDEKPTSVGQDG